MECLCKFRIHLTPLQAKDNTGLQLGLDIVARMRAAFDLPKCLLITGDRNAQQRRQASSANVHISSITRRFRQIVSRVGGLKKKTDKIRLPWHVSDWRISARKDRYSEREFSLNDDDDTTSWSESRSRRSGKTGAESTVKGKICDCRIGEPTYGIYKVYALPGVLSTTSIKRASRQTTRVSRREMWLVGLLITSAALLAGSSTLNALQSCSRLDIRK